MRFNLLAVYGGVFFFLACSQPSAKFNLSFPHRADQLIVSLTSDSDRASLERYTQEQGAELERLGPKSYLVHFTEASDLASQAETLAALSQVKSVEANQIYRLEEREPNDPGFSKTYGLKNTGQSGGLRGADIGAPSAWNLTVGSRAVVVGVIDSGIDYKHEDLAANIWSNPGESGRDAEGRDKRSNGIDDDRNGYVDDWHGWDFTNGTNDPIDENGHGTHVAGTIGAVGDNGIGVAGVNWLISMVPIKIFSASGETTSDKIVRAIDYATSLGVKVTNNSWGSGGSSPVMFEAIKRAEASGVLFVASAGNDASNSDVTPHYPSNYALSNIISVASTGRSDELSSFSNFGPKSILVAAPGESIYSTLPGNAYGMKSGTSMATPHVTGLVALLASVYPAASAAELKQKVLLTAAPSPALKRAVAYGRIAAGDALDDDRIVPSKISALSIEGLEPRALSLSFDEAGDDGLEGRAARYQFRVSDRPITDEATWAEARPVFSNTITRVAGRILAKVENLEHNESGFISVRAEDNAGNSGEIAESVAFALPTVAVLWENQNDDAAKWATLDSPWALEKQDGVSVLSDSGEGKYGSNESIKATSQILTFADSKLELSIRSRWDIEADYDFAYIEISRDQGASWVIVDTLTGVSAGWQTRVLNLEEALNGAHSFQLRLRLETDFSLHYDGWDIDSLQITGRASQP